MRVPPYIALRYRKEETPVYSGRQPAARPPLRSLFCLGVYVVIPGTGIHFGFKGFYFFAEQGEIDYLINAATGGERAVGPFMEMDMDGFQGSFAKLWGYTHSVRIGGAYLADDGAIVLISGYPARRCGPGMIAISTVGNAVEGFVRALAPEIAPKRINLVSPGLIDTPMFVQKGEDRTALFQEATKNHLIPRAGTPEEVASAVMFLLENQF